MLENNFEKVYLGYAGTALPEYYFEHQPIPGPEVAESEDFSGLIAISVGYLYGAADDFAWLKKYQPVARVGYSIYLYKF